MGTMVGGREGGDGEVGAEENPTNYLHIFIKAFLITSPPSGNEALVLHDAEQTVPEPHILCQHHRRYLC